MKQASGVAMITFAVSLWAASRLALDEGRRGPSPMAMIGPSGRTRSYLT